MNEDLLEINFHLKNENLDLKTENHMYKYFTLMTLMGMLLMTFAFIGAIKL